MTREQSPVEKLKARSNFLRGTLAASLSNLVSGALAGDDTQISKFHGVYQQDNRDERAERNRQKLEPAWRFMIRARIPGGIVTPAQWRDLDALARRYADASLRLTTRQAIQFHGVIKCDLRNTIRGINDTLLDTLAACGDVNRNVMCAPLANFSAIHTQALQVAQAISNHLTPRTRAYHELWLDGENVAAEPEHEPLYGSSYLPRKFKIAVAIPPVNDVDIYAQDLGFIAIARDGELAGFNVTVGGGMGVTHGDAATYPRAADAIGFCSPDQAIAVAEQVVLLQRDFGDRSNRRHARLKYTIDDRGVDWFREALATRLDTPLTAPRAFRFTHRGDPVGWARAADGCWNLTIHVPQGRVRDGDEARLLSGLNAIASSHAGEFRLTPNQNLIVAGVPDDGRSAIDRQLADYGIDTLQSASGLRQQALACVALPTCGLAMAEAERYLPDFSNAVERLLARHGLEDLPLSLRISGCPNGCSRPYLAEVALVGKAPGRYNLHLGGSVNGDRLNTMVAENLDEAGILAELDRRLARYAESRQHGEAFGDFAARTARTEGAVTPA
ncbi:MAG: assimilatory sulfite reductase (NADPH) hemoprotein subunit [Woeseiaceae bacterium]|nr:assimilatory sulfite reductase (NADPH) hemoprotein subunit [Woeseiaceae bacterium]